MKSILKLSFIASLIFCSQLAFGQTEVIAEKSSEKVTKENEEVPQIFKDYTWLKEMVNPKDCNGTTVSVRKNPESTANEFVLISKNGKRTLYTIEGKQHCADHSSVNCVEFYKLDEEIDSWTCK